MELQTRSELPTESPLITAIESPVVGRLGQATVGDRNTYAAGPKSNPSQN